MLAKQFDKNERAVERRSLADKDRLPRELRDRPGGRFERRRRHDVGDSPIEQRTNDGEVVLVFALGPTVNVAEPNAFLQEVGVLRRERASVEAQKSRKFVESGGERFEVVKRRMGELADLRLERLRRVGELELFSGGQFRLQLGGERGEAAQRVGVERFGERGRCARRFVDDRLQFVRVLFGRRSVFVGEERDELRALTGGFGERGRFVGEAGELRVRLEVGERRESSEPTVEAAQRAAQVGWVGIIFLFFGRSNDLIDQVAVLLFALLLRRSLAGGALGRVVGRLNAADVRRRAAKKRRRGQRRQNGRRRSGGAAQAERRIKKGTEISHRRNLERETE